MCNPLLHVLPPDYLVHVLFWYYSKLFALAYKYIVIPNNARDSSVNMTAKTITRLYCLINATNNIPPLYRKNKPNNVIITLISGQIMINKAIINANPKNGKLIKFRSNLN